MINVLFIFESKEIQGCNSLLANTQEEFDKILNDNKIHCIIAFVANGMIDKYGDRLKGIYHENPTDLKKVAEESLFASQLDYVSYYITAYNSGELILRPYNSLLAQTNQNWELIIVDDSEDNNNETSNIIKTIVDFRVKYIRIQHSGFIGEVKNIACRMCTGFVTAEIDHDDELTPEINDILIRTYKSNEEIAFVSTHFTEPYDDKEKDVSYEERHGSFDFGYGAYYSEFYKGRWRSVCNSGLLNITTVNSIVGVPNHIRTWRTEDLKKIGFNSHNFYVSDDYEIIVRTIIYCAKNNKKLAHLPILGYLQYRNGKIGNHTNKRINDIKKLWKIALNFYRKELHEAVRTLESGRQKIYDNYISNKYVQTWKMPWNWHPSLINLPSHEALFPGRISIVISTYNRPELLQRAIESCLSQDYQNFEILIVGDKCPTLAEFMKSYSDSRIRYHNLIENFNDGGATPKNYALRVMVRTDLVCYLDDDNVFKSNHLSSLLEAVKDKQFAITGIEIGEYNIRCLTPKLYRIDTSSFIHRMSLIHKYGYWKTHKDAGYCHDYELVSRWKNETYGTTGKITLVYNTETRTRNEPKKVFETYDDQKIHDVNVFLVCYNEHVMLPRVVAHYRKYLPECNITICDNESIDDSVEIAKNLGCDIISFQAQKIINYGIREVKNNCWKMCRGWIIVADIDEFLCVTHEDLEYEKHIGSTVLTVDGYQMIANSNEEDLSDISLEDVNMGVPHRSESKSLCFYTGYKGVVEMNYSLGAHRCKPVGNVVYSTKRYKNKHMAYVGLKYITKRHDNAIKRNKNDREMGYSRHYTSDEQVIERYYNDLKNKATLI